MSGRLTRRGGIPPKAQIRLLGKMLTLLDFRQENHFFVISISTISMCQNCSVSVLADPRGAKTKFAHLAQGWYNYDVQSDSVRGVHPSSEIVAHPTISEKSYSACHNDTGGSPNYQTFFWHPPGQPKLRLSNSDTWEL